MSARPHFQQAVYDEGYRAGHDAGMTDSFARGERFGRGQQKLDDAFKAWIGVFLGVVFGAALNWFLLWLQGVC